MKVVAVKITRGGAVAQVHLRPSWLARWFGAVDAIVVLTRDDDAIDDRNVWRSATTRRPLIDLDHGEQIRRALEAIPRRSSEETPRAAPHGEIPRAQVVQRDGQWRVAIAASGYQDIEDYDGSKDPGDS